MDDFYSVSTVNRFSMFSAVEDDPGDSPFSPTNASAPETINDVKKDKSGKARTKDKQQTTKTAPKQVENVTKKGKSVCALLNAVFDYCWRFSVLIDRFQRLQSCSSRIPTADSLGFS